jgi:hypothetical protein
MHDGVVLLTAGLHIVFTNLVTFIGPIQANPSHNILLPVQG